MSIPGLTAEQTTAAGHILGLVGAALIILGALASALYAVVVLHDPLKAWVPSWPLIGLCVGLIGIASVNDFLNTPKP